MQYVNLGRSGLKVSRLCLGCMTYGRADLEWYPHAAWALDEEQSRPFIRHALEHGINFFDTADYYGYGESEQILGRALRDFATRDEVVVATKVFYPMRASDPNSGGLSRKHLFEAIDASLARLGMDYVDLYQVHRWDPSTPLEETLEALHDIVKSGRARYIGASSMFAWQFAKALFVADQRGSTRFVSMQPHYNLAYREDEREMLPLCRDQGIGVIPWSPLARGFLAGGRSRESSTARALNDRYARTLYYRDDDYAVLDRLEQVALARDVPPAQVALAWLLSRDGVTAPIVGASKLHHLDDALAALSVQLSEAERSALEEPYQPHTVLGHE